MSLNYYQNQHDELAASTEEWPEIISVAKVGECHRIKTEQISKMKPKKEIDIRNISADELKSIQRQDPFMYYSIPGVRSAKVLMKEIDTSNLGEAYQLSRNCAACPSRLERLDGNTSQSNKVTRSSCISFECHPDLLLKNLLDDGEDACFASTTMTSSNPKITEADFVGLLCMFLELMENQDWATFEATALFNKNAFRRLSKYASRCTEFNGMTLLHAAVRNNPPNKVLSRMVKFYPEALKSVDCLGRMPLHVAAGCGAGKWAIKTLVVAFPKACQTQDDELSTPLHLACDSSCELFEDTESNSRGPPKYEVVKALLAGSGEAATLEDIDEMIALEYAIISDAPFDVVKLLQKATRDSVRARAQAKKTTRFNSPP